MVEDLDATNRLRYNLAKGSIYHILKKFINKVGYSEEASNKLIVLDFISGMTDNYVIRCLNELFVPKAIV